MLAHILQIDKEEHSLSVSSWLCCLGGSGGSGGSWGWISSIVSVLAIRLRRGQSRPKSFEMEIHTAVLWSHVSSVQWKLECKYILP